MTRALLTVIAAALLCTGCGAATPAPPDTPEVLSAIEEARGEPAADAIDACALVSDSEVETLIGPNGGASPFPGFGDGGGCTWENQENYHSVTVDVGSSGSAPGGGLPPQDPAFGPERPLGDGLRSLGGGAVEFVAADRLCLVQVVTSDLGGDVDEGMAVRLAGVVRDQL